MVDRAQPDRTRQGIDGVVDAPGRLVGETVDALAYKANVPKRTMNWLGEKKDALTGSVSTHTSPCLPCSRRASSSAARSLPARSQNLSFPSSSSPTCSALQLDQAKAVEDIMAAYPTLKARPECNGRIGAVGFCYGGGIANFLATRLPEDSVEGGDRP
mgnify:CR=1 FL=1